MSLYSHSRLTTSEDCIYKFKLAYRDRMDIMSLETAEIFEKLYKALLNGK